MSKRSQKIMIEEWPIERLRPHDRQAENYQDISPPELRRLMDVMREGRYDRIEVTPDGRIIDGHQRLRAASELRLTSIRVRVRHDLAGDEAAIEQRHLEANEIRRHECSLDRARNARRLAELKKGRGLTEGEMTDLVRELAELLGISPKHARRLLKIAELPMEIQAAVTSSKVGMVDAEKVHALDEQVQQQIAEEIRAGDDPRDVVNQYLPKKKRVAKDLGKELDRIVEAAERGRDVLDGRLDEIHRTGEQCGHDLRALRWLLAFAEEMIPKLKARKAEAKQLALQLEALKEVSAMSRRGRRT